MCLAGLLVSARVLPGAPPRGHGAGRLDLLGLALLSPGLAFIVYGLSAAGTHGSFAAPGAVTGLAAGTALLLGSGSGSAPTTAKPFSKSPTKVPG